MIMNSDVHDSLHHNCQRQLVFTSFDSKVCYPPPYEMTVWLYIKRTLVIPKGQLMDGFNLEAVLNDLDVNDQVLIFIGTIANIMERFIPNKN